MSNLKPCPFCGGEATEVDFVVPFRNGWVGCRNCRCHIDWIKNGKAEAVKRWNTRTPDLSLYEDDGK